MLDRTRWRRRKRAADFARSHFDTCATHAHEAAAVFVVVESIGRSPLPGLDPDAAIRDILPRHGVEPGPAQDSLDALELRLAVEEEHRFRDLAALAVAQLENQDIMKALLGPGADLSSWDPSTIWVRSVRGVINERVRLFTRACTCSAAPSNNEMQRTKHG